jgi:hypothetical protein
MRRQAKCVVTEEVLCGPEKGHNSMAGQALGMLDEAMTATVDWLALGALTFLASVAS